MNTEHTNQSRQAEPFGYFKAEPFGWTDCEKDDEGAIALYERPQTQPVDRDVLMLALRRLANEVVKFVPGGSIVDPQQICDGIRQIDLDAIADHYAARLPVEMHSTDLNDRKAAEIIQAQGFTATGYVLTGQDGRYALCNGGAVRWLDKAEYQRTMFPGVEHSPVPVAYLKTAAGVMQLSFEGNPVVAVGADIEVQADTVQPLFAQPPAQQQAQPRCACGDGFTSEAVCANCLAAQPQAEPVALIMCDGKSYDFMVTVEGQKRIPDTGEFVHLYATQPPAVAVPDGYALVPIKPTDSMLDAAVSAGDEPGSDYYTIYAAMLAAAPQAVPLSAALSDIAAERRRQIEAEGWTPEHDDAHSDGQMATAAACYAISAHNVIRYKRITMPSWWPWDSKWWKPGTTRRDLLKAGALIAAEIERLDRAAQKGGEA